VLANSLVTKLNWNNSRLDGREPITMRAARSIGTILRHVGDEDTVGPLRLLHVAGHRAQDVKSGTPRIDQFFGIGLPDFSYAGRWAARSRRCWCRGRRFDPAVLDA
jgi:hypothetical protein